MEKHVLKSPSHQKGDKRLIKTKKAWLFGALIFLTACTQTTESTTIVLQKSEDTAILSASIVSPFTFEESVETTLDTTPIKTVLKPMDDSRTGYSWLISKVSEGSYGYTETRYRSTYDSEGNLLSKEFIPDSEVYIEGKPTIYQYGAKVVKNAYFNARVITKYGYDCVGCYIGLDGAAGTSAGIRLNGTSVRQSDGSWREGITYDGYYVLAADKAFPNCTVLEISNHTFSGMGLTPGVAFKAIVVDRGGAITTNKLDLFVGSEKNINVVTNKRTANTKVTVVSFLKWTKNSSGERVCR